MHASSPANSCCSPTTPCAPPRTHDKPLEWFDRMIPRCLSFATDAKEQGRPVVGIMCEYTPRELILAAGGVPVCLCGGSVDTIASAEQELPANLCPLIKSTYGYFVEQSNPFLEMADLVVAETTCDGKKKMFELMGKSKPMYVLQLPHSENSAQGLLYWKEQLYHFKTHLEQTFQTHITLSGLRKAIQQMNEERRLRRALAGLMRHEVPPLTGCQLLDLKSIISCIPEDLEQYRNALEYYSSIEGPKENANRVRVLLTGVPTVRGAERVVELIENSGAIVVCQENCTGIKPIDENVDEHAPDPIQALAEKYYHLPCSIMTPNRGRIERLAALADEFKADCIIDLVWHACLTYDVESAKIKAAASEQLQLPYLKIETDYAPSDNARLQVRIEALLETAAQRKR